MICLKREQNIPGKEQRILLGHFVQFLIFSNIEQNVRGTKYPYSKQTRTAKTALRRSSSITTLRHV